MKARDFGICIENNDNSLSLNLIPWFIFYKFFASVIADIVAFKNLEEFLNRRLNDNI